MQPWLNPVREEFPVHRRLHHGTLTSHKRQEMSRIAHTVHIDEVLVLPVIGQKGRVGESMIKAHLIATSLFILCTSDSHSKRDIENFLIEGIGRDRRCYEGRCTGG